MSPGDDKHELESELENRKRDLREDVAQISSKIEEVKEKVSPTSLIRRRPFLASGAALLLGFAYGYFVIGRKLPVGAEAQSAIEHLGKPITRGALPTVGKEAAMRAVSRR
ncbi:MAG: hypothetical protein JO166_00785 [Deltaproteobacteria bacterium]|nr:hypothetical protein [Deltaproteobacteria bacterium]